MTDNLHAAALALRARIDDAVAELAAIRHEADDLVAMAAAAIPTAPDGTPIPALMLETARKIVTKMLASGGRPSKTVLATRLREEGFRVGKELEWPIWNHVAPMVEAQPDGSVEGGDAPAGEPVWAEVLTPMPLLDGDGSRAA
jgi:hypothetical protein